MKKLYFSLLALGVLSHNIQAQTTIGVQDFELTPATPTMTFSVTNSGSPGSGSGYTTGNSPTGTGASPSNSPLYVSGAQGYRLQGASGTATRTLTLSTVSTLGYSNVSASFRVAGMSIGSSANGMEAADYAMIEVSPDGGTTWYQQAQVNGVTNSRWAFSGTGSGSRAYQANNSLSTFTSGTGLATGNSAITTVTISALPSVSSLQIRISLSCNADNESWIIDDVIISGNPVTNYYPLTAATSDISQLNSWTTDATGSTSVGTPTDFSSGLFNINTNATVAGTGWSLTGASAIIANAITLNVAPTSSITVGTGSTFDMNGQSVVLQSTNAGSAYIGNTTGIISNATNVTIERHLQARRAWRLLAAPLAAGTAPSIFNSWQEAGSPSGSYGTWITNTSAGNGYDAASTTPSLKYWDGTNLVAPSATNGSTKITDNGGAYFLFVRGDRTITGSGTANSTILRMTGSINQGNVNNVGVIGSGSNPSLIPNPYPSSIDFEQIHTAYNSLTTFNVWDANLGTLGAYRLVDRNGGAYQQTPSGGSTTVDASARYIQSGQAFFIPAQQTINFTESMKATSNPTFNVFKTNSGVEELAVNLNIANTSGNILADGFRIKFDNSYASNAVQGEDITKMENINENLGVSNNGTDLIVDKRPVSTNDTIQLRFWNSRISNYTLDFEPSNMNSFSSVYLLDSHLGTLTTINAAATSSYSFNVDNNAGSYDPMRFKIVFTANPTSIEATKVAESNVVVKLYPNPITKDKQLHIQIDNLKEATYTVQVYNISGQLIISEVLTNNVKNATDLALDVNRLSEGTHLIKIMGKDGKIVATSTFIVNK